MEQINVHLIVKKLKDFSQILLPNYVLLVQVTANLALIKAASLVKIQKY